MSTHTVTTPIYYVNDRPHIGHCYTTLVADVVARAHRLFGADVFFLTGTDEHAEKVSKAASAQGLSPQEWADRNAEEFREAFGFMRFSQDDFIRTTEDRHARRAAAYIQMLVDSGDIELGQYEGWYDPVQEEYVTETGAKEHDYKSPVTGRPLERRAEENYFFRLDKYEGWLREAIESDRIRVRPEARRNEVLARVREGLQKVPVSRRIKEGDPEWGIRMPGDPDHRIYVWIEALCNYLTAVDNAFQIDTTEADGGSRRKYWPADVHLMAKDILWFHAVIWPALLEALGEEPPKMIYAHAYFVSEGRKMSKSLGNFIEIDQLRAYAERYSIDAVRWYLATQGPLGPTDADFAYRRFVELYNAELANGIGNAVSRVGNMIGKYFDGRVPDAKGVTRLADVDWVELAERHAREARARTAELDLHGALHQGTALVAAVDGFINVTEPFRLAKKLDEAPMHPPLSNREALGVILYQCAEALRIASLLLWSAMPDKMAGLWRAWGCSPLRDPEDPDSGFEAPLEALVEWGGEWSLRPGAALERGEALFMRADPGEPAPASGASTGGG